MKCELCNRNILNLTALNKHIVYSHHESILYYYNNYLAKSSLDGFCHTCGKPTQFTGLNGYRAHCNNFCAQRDPVIIQKIHSEETHKKISIGLNKIKNSDEYKQSKRKAREKAKNTVKIKYGVDNISKAESVKNKQKQTVKNKKEQFSKDYNCTPRTELIKKYGQGWLKLPIKFLFCGRVAFVKNSDISLIEQYINHRSIKENLLYDFINSIYDGPILRNTQRILTNYGRCELDIYLPDINLAFEYNSNYYHNFLKSKNEYYHYNKSLNCWLNNIRLIHIYEFEDFNEQLQLIKDLIYYGFDNYDRTNNNKYFNFDNHKPSIIYKSNNCIIYSA